MHNNPGRPGWPRRGTFAARARARPAVCVGVLEQAFSQRPQYLADVQSRTGEVDFGNRSLELTRRARGLKLWLMFRTHGAVALRQAVARGIMLAEHAQALIDADPDWRCVTPAQLGIVTFTRAGWAPRSTPRGSRR